MYAHAIDPASFLLGKGIWPTLCTPFGQPVVQFLQQWLARARTQPEGQVLMCTASNLTPRPIAAFKYADLDKAFGAYLLLIAKPRSNHDIP